MEYVTCDTSCERVVANDQYFSKFLHTANKSPETIGGASRNF